MVRENVPYTAIFYVYPPHPHWRHHRNFDPGICEVVGSTKYGSFLSNFRGILALQSIQDPQLHAPHQFPNIFPQSSSISDTPPQFRSSRDYYKIHLHFTEHFNGLHSPSQCPAVLQWLHIEANQSSPGLPGHSQSQTVANFSPNLSPKKPTNQGEGWPVTKFGHLSFKRVKLGQLFGNWYNLLTDE